MTRLQIATTLLQGFIVNQQLNQFNSRAYIDLAFIYAEQLIQHDHQQRDARHFLLMIMPHDRHWAAMDKDHKWYTFRGSAPCVNGNVWSGGDPLLHSHIPYPGPWQLSLHKLCNQKWVPWDSVYDAPRHV